MENGFNTIAGKGLGFFGKITASISHELKNSLAIINEKAGLLEDFALMANKGIPLDPERMESLAGQIIKQVGRANDIIRTLNVFAHSAEEPLKNTDLAQVLTLVIRLCSRFADMKSVTMAPIIPTDPMTIQTRPFFAEHLICQCLTAAMDWAGLEKNIEIGMEHTNDDVRIHIFSLDTTKQPDNVVFPDKETQLLANALHARVEQNRESGKLSLVFPRKIPCLDSKIAL
jgi:signal transduction histidine kinase